jgi:hypothetical protein
MDRNVGRGWPCMLSLALSLALPFSGGCDDDVPPAPAVDAGVADATTVPDAQVSADASAAVDALSVPPLYAMMTQVYRLDDRSVFVSLSNTLDITGVSLPTTREWNGVANLAAVGGRLLISDGEKPQITEFTITPDLRWQEGRTVSFASYPLTDNANFYYQFLLDDHTAYLPYDATKRIIWDPTAMEIRGTMEDTSLALEVGGLQLEAGGNRNSVRYDGLVLQAFFYHDKDWFDHGTRSHIVGYDPKTHKESKVIDAPCAGLSIATRDEQGNTYFSTWGYLPTRALYRLGPPPCVVRIKADITLDPTFTTDLTNLTGGRYTNNFRYIGNGKAIANVLHHELLGVSFAGQYDPAIEEKIGQTGPHWRLWLFDVVKSEARPIDGIDVAIGSGAQFTVLDGRTFIFLPFEDWGKTKVFELDAAGRAQAKFETVGDIFKWIKVR